MPQFGFYMAGGAAAGVGRLGLLMAWDPLDRGPSAADDIDFKDIALYAWIGPLPALAPQVIKIKSRSPISIPAEGCPATLDSPDRDYVLRFGLKSGGVGASPIVDGWLEVFEGQTRVYGATPVNTTMKIELAEGSFAAAIEASMQDRVVYQGLEDPPEDGFWMSVLGGGVDSKEIWRELMTPNQPLRWI
jgi:hypothetical protein